MRFLTVIAVVLMTTSLGACANRLGERTLPEYCSDPAKANADLCKVNAEIGSTRQLAQQGVDAAGRAQTTADQASAMAQQAQAALASGIQCETKTLRRATSGSCNAGYQLMSCTQSRYTTRAGGLTPIRHIDSDSCRFAGRVLEMKVRCCMVGGAAPISDQQPMSEPTPQPQSAPTS